MTGPIWDIVFRSGTFGLLLAVIGLIVRVWILGAPERRRVANERESNLLEERAEEMDKLRKRIDLLETRAEAKDQIHEAERSLDRHKYNNLSQCFDALMMLLRQKPANVPEAIEAVEKMRTEQLARENIEKAAISAAKLKAGLV